MTPYTYNATVDRVIDADTIDVVVDLGFNIFHPVRVRLLHINAPETRTKNKVEKAAGLAAKAFVESLVSPTQPIILHSEKIDKFGRSLGSIEIIGRVNNYDLASLLLEKNHAQPYDGKGKAKWKPPTNPKD